MFPAVRRRLAAFSGRQSRIRDRIPHWGYRNVTGPCYGFGLPTVSSQRMNATASGGKINLKKLCIRSVELRWPPRSDPHVEQKCSDAIAGVTIACADRQETRQRGHFP
jgi:hypothetical protein